MAVVIARNRHLDRVQTLLRIHPSVAILGARQVGKTTLARMFSERWRGSVKRFDLEDPDDLVRLEEPKLALGALEGLVILDEVQRRPDLFPVLRVLVDRPENRARFLILGSASPDLLRQGSETLAGRIGFHELDGLALDETGVSAAPTLWFRGGFPRSFLAGSDEDSAEWRAGFVRTFLERDLPQLGSQIPSAVLHRFWRMLAHHHAQTWNGAELARALGVSGGTVRRYLDLLTAALVMRQLAPWHENLAKRQVKAPKVYLADSGVLHTLLGIETPSELDAHPKVGASWEGFVLKELVRVLGARAEECYFWATHAGAELDLLFVRGALRRGFEIKRTTSPSTTRSMHAAREALGLERIDVIHAGSETFMLRDGIRAVAFSKIAEDLEPA
jgi:predicted AAA+ superfamily ATPase